LRLAGRAPLRASILDDGGPDDTLALAPLSHHHFMKSRLTLAIPAP